MTNRNRQQTESGVKLVEHVCSWPLSSVVRAGYYGDHQLRLYGDASYVMTEPTSSGRLTHARTAA